MTLGTKSCVILTTCPLIKGKYFEGDGVIRFPPSYLGRPLGGGSFKAQGVPPHTGYSLDLPYLATFLDNLFTVPEDADSDRLRHNYSTLAPSTAHHKNTHSGSHYRYLPAEVRIHSTLNHITHAQSITRNQGGAGQLLKPSGHY